MTEPSILQRLNVSSLPSPPNVAVKILNLAKDPNASLLDMAEALAMDPALSAQVLRVCNTAAYGRGREITSLQQAVTVLGSKTVSVVALGFSLKSAISTCQHSDGLTDTDLWRHTVATAVTARSLARLARVKDLDSTFLCGLLSRIGQLLLFSELPDDYGKVLDSALGKIPTCELEQEHLGFTHQEAGGLLLDSWGLPDLLSQVVRTWGTGAACESEKINRIASIVAISDSIALMLFDQDIAQQLTTIYQMSEQELGLSHGEIDRMISVCGEEISETLEAFDIPLDATLDGQSILEDARQQLLNISLGLAADLTAANDNKSTLEEQNKKLAKASLSDGLTGLNNRAGLDRELTAMDSARRASKQPIAYSIIMVDLDKFKSINDTHGHSAGDDVLRSVGETLMQCARATDFVARYGGEEFVVVLTNAGKAEAASVAERFRASVERKPIELKDGIIQVTASVGVASSDSFPAATSHQEVLEAADQALYAAKRSGRNRVTEHGESPQVCS